ncbi:MAG: hypothetical protein VYA54_02090 [Bdellovibrionota bacterium]|nr:hypothetical protein [Bdellovibrionota bacterium]
MKLVLIGLLGLVSTSVFAKSCFERKYQKKYEKCLRANILNQKKCYKKKDKWEKKCAKEDSAKQKAAEEKARFQSVDKEIKAGRIANQSLEIWKDNRPYAWKSSGAISATNNIKMSGNAAVISGKGSLSQSGKIDSRKWHGFYLRYRSDSPLKGNEGLTVKIEVTKNGNKIREYSASGHYPYPKLWEMVSIAMKPELYQSQINLTVNWNLPNGKKVYLDDIRILDIGAYEKEENNYRNYLKKEALK